MSNAQDLFERRKSRPVRCGNLTIGGSAKISIQTMAKTDTRDIRATVEEIQEAVSAGADIVRVAVVDEQAARAIKYIKEQVTCPIVADIHFDYRLAMLALESGSDKVRVNPGNIGSKEKLLEVARKAQSMGAAVRLGVNSGSLEKDVLETYGSPCAEAMVESAKRHDSFLLDNGIEGAVISLKSSSVKETIRAYSIMASYTDWPFHIGVTETGPGNLGVTKSAAGIGTLLTLGIGDTVRVSLTGPAREEVVIAKAILQSLELGTFGPDIISCPTCGRTEIDIIHIAEAVKDGLKDLKTPIKVAIMGCPVNGPGEAREADIGIACGREGGILFSHGKPIGRVSHDKIVDTLLRLARTYPCFPEGEN